MHFTLMVDEGTFKFKQNPACVDAACILNKLKSDFTYANGSYFGSPSYLKEGGRPVVWVLNGQPLAPRGTRYTPDFWLGRVSAPIARSDLELATHLSAFVEGKAADNTLQMRLSAYVLAHRLSQVVAAANERLVTMSDQRYSLEHTGLRGAGETRGGLSLRVRDDWSGEARDPATLSGGETFVVSLALALGLADVITQEAGGADLDTLFVDEGFGSQDQEGRMRLVEAIHAVQDEFARILVITHIDELKDAFPTRLEVTKSPSGSQVSVY